MRFHQDSVVLRLTVVCVEWRCDQDGDATRFDAVRFSHHHTILDAQLSPLFVCSCASRPSAEQPGPASVVLLAHAALGALNGLDLDAIGLRDRPLSGAQRDAAGDLGAGHGAGYFDAGDLDAGSLMPRWAP